MATQIARVLMLYIVHIKNSDYNIIKSGLSGFFFVNKVETYYLFQRVLLELQKGLISSLFCALFFVYI
jgi:hypothetical protein